MSRHASLGYTPGHPFLEAAWLPTGDNLGHKQDPEQVLGEVPSRLHWGCSTGSLKPWVISSSRTSSAEEPWLCGKLAAVLGVLGQGWASSHPLAAMSMF